MADLEDFFAKRDKGKKKKFTTVDDATKQLEDRQKEKAKATSGRSNYESGDGALSEYKQQQIDDDDEWLEKTEQEPDYTGLKVQELVLEDSEDELADKEEEKDVEGDPDIWTKVRAKERKPKEEEKAEETIPVAAEPTEEVKEKKEEEELAKPDVEVGAEENKPAADATDEPKKGGYLPPHMRPGAVATPASSEDRAPESSSGGGGGSGAYVPPSRRAGATAPSKPKPKPGAVPNIGNEESFPALS